MIGGGLDQLELHPAAVSPWPQATTASTQASGGMEERITPAGFGEVLAEREARHHRLGHRRALIFSLVQNAAILQCREEPGSPCSLGVYRLLPHIRISPAEASLKLVAAPAPLTMHAKSQGIKIINVFANWDKMVRS